MVRKILVQNILTRDSNVGDISITSFFPSKPLGCYGIIGAIFTNNDEYAAKIKNVALTWSKQKIST